MAKWILSIIGALVLLSSNVANATFIFSDISYTANSLTFTIDGDMQGYTQPTPVIYGQTEFSVRFLGNILTGLAATSANTWSRSPFDNETIDNSGFAINNSSTIPYAWSSYTNSLMDAVSNNVTVTLSWANNLLDPNATDPTLAFLWGNGNTGPGYDTRTPTVLATITVGETGGEVPLPAPATLLLLGLACLAVTRTIYNRSSSSLFPIVMNKQRRNLQ